MKKIITAFLLVAMAASLFVGCSNDIAPTKNQEELKDSTAKIVIANGSMKEIEATGNDESYAVEDLYWFYTAVKTSGSFITGQKTEFYPVKGTEQEPQKGLANSDLGEFSKGGWRFVFKGYHDIPEVFDYEDLETDTDAAYYAINQVNLTGDLALEIELHECDGMPPAGFRITNISLAASELYDPEHCLLYVINGTYVPAHLTPEDSIITPILGWYDEFNDTVVFLDEELITLPVGIYNLLFVATSPDAIQNHNVIGCEPLTLVVKKGVQQMVSGTIGLDNDMSDITVSTYTYATSVPVAFDLEEGHLGVVLETAPVADAGKATSLAFEFEELDPEVQEKLLNVATVKATIATAAAASEASETGDEYVISDDSHAGIAAIDLTLTNQYGFAIDLNAGDGVTVLVSTYVLPGLGDDNVIVTYNGTTEGISNVHYDSETGLLEFTTNHFSTFMVEFEGIALDYATGAAVDDVNTLVDVESDYMLMKDIELDQVQVNAEVTILLNNHMIEPKRFSLGEGLHIYRGDGYISVSSGSCGETETEFSGGDGTDEHPYIIASEYDLRYLAAYANAGHNTQGLYFSQVTDIRLNYGTWTPIGRGYRTTETGESTPAFRGVYDGGEHIIFNLTDEGYSAADSLEDDHEYTYGLFGTVEGEQGEGGAVVNVTLSNVDIDGYVEENKNRLDNGGAVVGYLNGGVVYNCHVTSGHVTGNGAIGGVVGRAYKTFMVMNSSNAATVSSNKNVGGIIGFLNPTRNAETAEQQASGTVTGCINTGTIHGYKNGVAGIACFALGNPDSGKPSEGAGSLVIQGNVNMGDLYSHHTMADTQNAQLLACTGAGVDYSEYENCSFANDESIHGRIYDSNGQELTASMFIRNSGSSTMGVCELNTNGVPNNDPGIK